MNWTSADIAAAQQKGQKQPATRPAPSRRPTATSAPVEARSGAVTPAFAAGSDAPRSYLPGSGRWCLSVAAGTHYPGRMRLVLTGPLDEGLLAHLVQAVAAYSPTPTPTGAAGHIPQ